MRPTGAAWSGFAGSLARVALLCALGMPRGAQAYGERAPIDIELLRPAPGDARILSTDLARVGEPVAWVPQVFLHYADRPLVLLCRGQCPPRDDVALVGDRVTMDLSVAVSLARRVQLAVSLPVLLYQYRDPAIMDAGGEAAGSAALTAPLGRPAGIGDARLHAKVALLPRRMRVGLGIDGALSLPTGDGDSFMGTRLPAFTARLLAHVEYRRFTAALNFGGRFASHEEVLALPSGLALTYGLGGQILIFGRAEGSPFYLLAELYGLAYARFAQATDFPAEFLIAAKSEPGSWSLFVGAGSTLWSGVGTPNIRGLIGLAYSSKRAPRSP